MMRPRTSLGATSATYVGPSIDLFTWMRSYAGSGPKESNIPLPRHPSRRRICRHIYKTVVASQPPGLYARQRVSECDATQCHAIHTCCADEKCYRDSLGRNEFEWADERVAYTYDQGLPTANPFTQGRAEERAEKTTALQNRNNMCWSDC